MLLYSLNPELFRLVVEDLPRIMKRISNFLKVLYLFGKSDIPAAALPSVRMPAGRIHSFLADRLIVGTQMAIALVLAGPASLSLIAKGFLWLEIHLLTFQVHECRHHCENVSV